MTDWRSGQRPSATELAEPSSLSGHSLACLRRLRFSALSQSGMSLFSRMKKRSPPDSAPAAVGLASQSQATQLLTKSQLHSHSLQQKQQSPPMYPWFALAPSLGQSPSPFPRYGHAVSMDANAAGELFLFGGHASMFRSNVLYVFSTRHFSTTLADEWRDSQPILFIWCCAHQHSPFGLGRVEACQWPKYAKSGP